MFLNIDDLGEKTLNKIAEFALSTQLERAEKLSVQIKTDPNKLAKGVLESLAIDGEGLVMNKDLRMQELKMTFNAIAVSPLKALMGNIQLTQPSRGYASIVLTEADLESAFGIQTLKKQLKNARINLDEQAVTADIDRINCRIFDDGRVAINVEVYLSEIRESREICLLVKPYISTTGNGIALNDIEYLNGEELLPILTPILLSETEKIFNLRNFLMDGISLQIERLTIEEGKLTLQAAAEITRFPSA
jgi:hypothetical protein